MRKFLLASVATLGTTGGLMGAALAQTPPGAPVPQPPMSAPVPISGPIGAPNQGQQAWPAAPAPVAYVNDNNNYQAPMLPGAVANPTPGTIVVHINAKVQVDAGAMWTSADTRTFTAPSGAPGAAPITSIGSGPLAARSRNVGEHGADFHPWCERHRHGQAATAGHWQLRPPVFRRRRHGDEWTALRRGDRSARELQR